MALAGAPNEVVHLLLLDSRNRLIGETTLFEGTIDQSQVYPRRIIEQSLSHRASGFILVHNHPSGAVAPSADDEAMTRKLAEAARTIDLRFLDHLIVGREGEGHFSFREQGLLRDT
jgi:DNA repair protein RadC